MVKHFKSRPPERCNSLHLITADYGVASPLSEWLVQQAYVHSRLCFAMPPLESLLRPICSAGMGSQILIAVLAHE